MTVGSLLLGSKIFVSSIVSRQANQCADGLARMSFSLNADFLFFDSPPVDIIDVFEGDLIGRSFPRSCIDPCFGL